MSDTAGAGKLLSGLGPPPRLEQTISQERIAAYAQASGDHNPIHLDLQYAQQVGLPSTIAHGLLTLGAACAEVEAWAGKGAWVSLVACRFANPLASGSKLQASPTLSSSGPEQALVEFEAHSGSGERILSRGRIELRPVPDGEAS